MQPVYIYTGCALRAVKERIAEHGHATALVDNPTKKYYLLRNSTSAFSSQSISLATIPIDGRLDKATKTHRRLLCCIAETFFSIWLSAFDPSSKQAENLTMCSREALGDAYGFSTNVVGWEGLATHSPLKEHTGAEDYRVCSQVLSMSWYH